jgi:hypothetical protein
MTSRRLVADLRSRRDEALVALLHARPDLVSPVPVDFGQLAGRAAGLSSVYAALDQLDGLSFAVAETLCVLPQPTTYADLCRRFGGDPSAGLEQLRSLALVWGGDDALFLAPAVRQLLPDPAGLGPPLRTALDWLTVAEQEGIAADLGLPADDRTPPREAITAVLTDPARLEALLADLPPAAVELVDRLAAGPATGSLPGPVRRVPAAQAGTPVEDLLARGLVVAVDERTIVLPREVGLHRRGGIVPREVVPRPPELVAIPHDPTRVDRTAADSASTTLRRVEELLESWGRSGPPPLRSGGLGVRELRRTAARLTVDEATAALLIETAYAAGLLDRSWRAEDPWLPTPAYDEWLARPPERRWAALAAAWLHSPRAAAAVGTRDPQERPVAALSAEVATMEAPDVRARLLAELAGLPPGAAPQPPTLLARMRWLRPRRAAVDEPLIVATLREAELLGVTGLGALSRPGRVLAGAAGDPATDRSAAVAAELAPLLPAPVDFVLLQADLTAVAPGPLTRELTAELTLVADVESRGGATVYRFTPASVRRALDAGRSAADLHRLLAESSRTPVPQPLRYLVDDLARRHGRIRVGTATAYVRCDDEAVLTELLADRRSDGLQLRRLAPTVLSAGAAVSAVLEHLREWGYAPMPEGSAGEVVVRRPDSQRCPAAPRPWFAQAGRGNRRSPTDAQLAAVVGALRATDQASSSAEDSRAVIGGTGGTGLQRTTPAQTLGTLLSAAAAGERLCIGYVNAAGRASVRVIRPISVEGGVLSAHDQLSGEVRTFALHRVTGIGPAPPG